jgi:cellulose synthase/poly-beta-1,6-N-acetylglucosamine synthase-like glycosyltransferase
MNFDVVIADGSPDDAVEKVTNRFRNKLTLQYLYKKDIGISEARNWGAEKARGEYIVFFDSDCVIPPEYFKTVCQHLSDDPLDAYGGPDKAAENFSRKQKAISYAMTSVFTTGGIRGRKNHVGQYQPRSFNMGIRRDIFNLLGGFSGLRVSEDIDLSMRLYRNGYRVGLIEDAFVYHKRRATYYKFYRQVFSFGSGRIDLQVRHGNALKVVHILPSLFVACMVGGLIAGFFFKSLFWLWAVCVLTYALAIGTEAALQNHSFAIGFMSIYASFLMLFGYGLGMIKGVWMRFVMKSNMESEKPEITKY